jgi:hypothetical protein
MTNGEEERSKEDKSKVSQVVKEKTYHTHRIIVPMT